MGEQLDKLNKVVPEEDANILLKLYTKMIEYRDYIVKQGYDENFYNLATTLIDEIDNFMEE
jgi:hypothetical protein